MPAAASRFAPERAAVLPLGAPTPRLHIPMQRQVRLRAEPEGETAMNDDDRAAIADLFARLGEVEGRSGPRDRAAEAMIRAGVAAQPAAPYYMAQTIVVQNAALREAERRLAELEARDEERADGLFGGLFGGAAARPSVPPVGRRREQPPVAGRGDGGNGFLAGAAQTALGVAGGVFLGNLIAGAMVGSGDAAAAEPDAEAAPEADPADDLSGPDGAADGDFGGDFDFGDF